MMVAFPNPELSVVAEGALEGMVEDGSSPVVGVGAMGAPVDVGAKRYPLTWTAHTWVAIELVVDQEPAELD